MSNTSFASTTDPTQGVSYPDPTQIPLQGLPSWLVAILTQNPGTPVGSGTTTPTQTSNGSSIPWGTIASAGATGLGAILNYQANAARNNLLQQQISSNNQIAQSDQARRDYYASMLMPSILQGLRQQNNPQSMAAVQQQRNQALHFPAPLNFSGTGVTAGTPTTTQTTQVAGAPAAGGVSNYSPQGNPPAGAPYGGLAATGDAGYGPPYFMPVQNPNEL